jgi:hypothetical protein
MIKAGRLAGGITLLALGSLFLLSHIANAEVLQTLPYQDRWNSGWNYGLEQARADWEAHAFEYTSIVASQVTCPSEHTQAFCDGFMAAYNEQWNIWVENYQAGNTQVSQQGASCNIINSPGSSCSLQQQSTQGGN